MGGAGGADWIGVLEAAYALELGEEEWLQQIADRIRPGLDAGLGVMAWRYDVRDPDRASFAPTVMSGGTDWMRSGPVRVRDRHGGRATLDIYTRSSTVETGRRALAGATGREDAFDEVYPDQRVANMIALRSSPTERIGVLVGAPVSVPVELTRGQSRRLAHIAAHLGAAFRLREGLRCEEAILRADGRVEHAEGGAKERSLREALREAARRIDRARGRLRKSDAWEAVSLWQGLVSGRWSLVDRFDADGRRHFVAMRNPVPSAALRALTTREAQVVTLASRGISGKLVGYHLGIGESTASTLLARALKKLGITRAELPLLAELALVSEDEP